MKIHILFFTLFLLFMTSSLAHGQESTKRGSTDIEMSNITKNGVSVAQFTSKRNFQTSNSLNFLISISEKQIPEAKNFRHMANIASLIYDTINGVGKEHRYKASVRLSNLYDNMMPTFIEIDFNPDYSRLSNSEIEELKLKLEKLF